MLAVRGLLVWRTANATGALSRLFWLAFEKALIFVAVLNPSQTPKTAAKKINARSSRHGIFMAFCACKENIETFKASPGCAVLGLRLHNGRGLVLCNEGHLQDAFMIYMCYTKLNMLVKESGAKDIICMYKTK